MIAQNSFQIAPGEGSDVELAFIGPQTIGEEILLQEGISHKKILAGKIRRYSSLQNIFDIFKLPVGLCQALWHLFVFMPNAVFSKGGYGSVPVVLAAWLFRIPVLIHESDAIAGLANKFCAKFSKKVAISFKGAAKFFPVIKTALTGNPVRSEILNGSKEKARELFGLSGTKSVLLILGGSQGAKTINEAIIPVLLLLMSRCEIIHQTGAENLESVKEMLNNRLPAGYQPYPFLNEKQLRAAYATADLVISRAGAGSIAEIAVLGKPSILIPLSNSAGDHQHENAADFADFGATEILEQANLTPHMLQSRIFRLLDNPDLLKKMAGNAEHFNPPDAAQKIAQEILSIAKY